MERRLRRLIDAAMTEKFGPDWHTKLDKEMFDGWTKRQRIAIAAGDAPLRPIEYADFTDYEKIIVRRDHWREVFDGIFKRKESVIESLQRLYPIRLSTMHARFVGKSDELFVIAECTRIMKAYDQRGA